MSRTKFTMRGPTTSLMMLLVLVSCYKSFAGLASTAENRHSLSIVPPTAAVGAPTDTLSLKEVETSCAAQDATKPLEKVRSLGGCLRARITVCFVFLMNVTGTFLPIDRFI